MQSIWHDLRDKEVVDAIALDRARRLGFEDVFERMREDIGKRADAAVALIGKYMEGGPRNNVLETLRALRHERLAHRQLSPATAPGASKRDGRRDRRVLSGQFKAQPYSPEPCKGDGLRSGGYRESLPPLRNLLLGRFSEK